MTNAENLMAIKEATMDIDFLGKLLWFSISDMQIKRVNLEDAFQVAGLDEKYLPNPISVRDAFRRATSGAELKNHALDKDKKLNLLVREVKMDNDEIIRQLVREVVDAENVTLEYTPIASFKLANEDYEVELLAGADLVEIDVIRQAQLDFEVAKEHYNGAHVRDMITKVLKDCDPVAVRPSGGVYFVPEKYAGTVDALKSAVKEISTATCSKSRLWTIPVIEADEHKEMLSESLEDQVASSSNAPIHEMDRIIKSGRRIGQKTAQGYVEQVRNLKSMVKQYEEMLDMQANKARSDLEIVMKQALKLLESVEAA